MSSQGPTVKAAKKSAFSCESCRKRKVKCGGEQPTCNRCSARNDICVYTLSPTLSYTQKLESQVKELEDIISRTQNQPPENLLSKAAHSYNSNSLSRLLPCEPVVPELLGTFGGLKLDDKGSVTYHGATSFFQLPTDHPQIEPLQEEQCNSTLLPSEGGQRRERLVNNAWQQRVMETFSETPEPFQHLLSTHWCWIQPLFNFIYRPAFTRDMETLGPYYSHTLLNAMLSHSVRWCKNDERISHLLDQYDGGLLFGRQARTLLFDELSRGSNKIPSVQTLLLLSAQECSAGNRTQAWLYSGMAFRLIEDIGITIDGQRYAGSVLMSDEDIEIRHRLFWSCYFWDKLISLYLGRSPSLQHSTVSPPQIMLDDYAENEPWVPHGLTYPIGMEYPPTKAHSISCFMRMCRLSVILNQILIHIYDPLQQNTEAEIRSCLDQEGTALRLWWDELPDFLRIDAKTLPSHCPPSHIVTLNCLYHTFKILLFRPMLFRRSHSAHSVPTPDPNHIVECISSATSIIAIFDLFCRSFGEGHCILSLSYSVYTAASIFLLQIQAATSHDEQTLRRLEFCIHALERVKIINPVIGSSLALITQALSKIGIDLSSQLTREVPMSENEQFQNTRIEETFSHHLLALAQDPAKLELNGTFQIPALEDFNMDDFEITPELFEAFSTLQPISATVGALQDFS